MSATKILIAAAVAAILSTLACAKPRHIRSYVQNNDNLPQYVDLSHIQTNNTVCPIKVEYDVKENRVPRRIKTIKCAEQPNHCSEENKAHECCKLSYNNVYLSCVEIIDKVRVFYKDNTTTTTVTVSVGCSCMINNLTEAKPARGHN